MKKLIATSLIVTGLALAVTSCGADGGQATSATDSCEEVLGAPGLKWVKEKAKTDEVERGGVNLEYLRKEYYRQMDPWRPNAHRWESEICTMDSVDIRDQKQLTIEFGPSYIPFDFDEKETPDGTLTPVNSDVKLLQTKNFKNITHYGIYVKCKIPGTSSRQEIVTPLAGVLTDTLTGGTSDADHMRYLLHATRVVVDTLGCENNPSIPAAPPASID